MLLFDWLPAADALPLAAATIRVFAAHGDRTNRGKARLRHVRERMGDEAFSRLIREAFAAAKAERNWPDVTLTEPSAPLNARAVLTFANGDVTPAMADELGDLAADERLRVRIANQHRVVVFCQDFEVLAGALRNGKTLSAAARPQPSVVACPGKRWCSRALVHTNRVADRIRAELGDKLPPQMTVCISGCPNGCSHSAVANIGLSGVMASQGGAVAEAFNLYVGGGMGRTNALARLVASRLSPEEVLGCIERVLAASGASSVEREEN
jgi:sulfite reductase beta subunit-like hemoprotein